MNLGSVHAYMQLQSKAISAVEREKSKRETGTKAKVVCIGFSKEDNDGERESTSRIPCPALWDVIVSDYFYPAKLVYDGSIYPV